MLVQHKGFSNWLRSLKTWDFPLDDYILALTSINQVVKRFIRIRNIWPTTSHVQLICRNVIKKLWTFYGRCRGDRSQSPPCWKRLIIPGKTNAAIHGPHLYGVGSSTARYDTWKTRDIEPMLVECWSSICDAGPTFKQHWFSVSCFLGRAMWHTVKGWGLMSASITSCYMCPCLWPSLLTPVLLIDICVHVLRLTLCH